MRSSLRVLAAGLVLVGAPAAIASAEAVRTVLSASLVAGAPGQTLDLYKVTIPGGTTLPLHYHPGSQVSHIVKGALKYTVVRGYAYVTTPNGTDVPDRKIIRQGQTVMIPAGKGLVEPKDMQHVASTPRGETIVMLAIVRKKGTPGTIVVAP